MYIGQDSFDLQAAQMRIHLNQIPDIGLEIEFCEDPADYPVFCELKKSGECELLGPLEIRLNLNKLRNMVEMRGRLETRLRLRCSRCVKSFETNLNSEFQLIYEQHDPGPVSSLKAEIELTTDDVGFIFFQGEVIDTHQAIQEEVLAAVPLKPLCNSTCMGLCRRCGADLNKGPCGCEKEDIDPRLAILKNLR